jgi:hypothetical protein
MKSPNVKVKALALIFCLALEVTASAAFYNDEKTGFRLWYPNDLSIRETSDSYRGLAVFNQDRTVSLVAFSSQNTSNEGIAQRMSAEQKSRGEAVSYSAHGENWFVLSGVNAKGLEFYHRVSLISSNGESWWIEWELTYPHVEHDRYDRWAEWIAKSFKP